MSTQKFECGNLTVNVLAQYDFFTTLECDAVVIPIATDAWYDYLNELICRYGRDQFHAVARDAYNAGLTHAQTVVSPGEKKHDGAFRDVVFVYDESLSPKNTFGALVAAAIKTAEAEGYVHIAVPLHGSFRGDWLSSQSPEAVRRELASVVEAVKQFAASAGVHMLDKITFVVPEASSPFIGQVLTELLQGA